MSAGTVVASTTATTAVTVIHPNTGLPNTAPIANDDSMTVMGVDAVNIRVLDNDYSNPAENDFLSIEIITQPSQGYASPGGSLTIDYTPYAPLTGPDTFQYRLTDTFGASDIATVTLSPPQGFTLSKTLIDIGQLRAGRDGHGAPERLRARDRGGHHRVRSPVAERDRADLQRLRLAVRSAARPSPIPTTSGPRRGTR